MADETTKKTDDENLDGDGEGTTNTPNPNDAKSRKQSPEENARFKAMRLEQERKERERLQKDSYEKGQIDALKVNPYTQEPINSKEDLYIYNMQKKLEDEGKDPIADLPNAISKKLEKDREDSEAKTKERDALSERANKDVQDFYDKGHTKEELDEFLIKIKSDKWKNFFGDSIETGHISPARAYEAMKEIEKDAVENASKTEKKKENSTPPNPNSTNKSHKTIDEMTSKEIDELYNAKYKKHVG